MKKKKHLETEFLRFLLEQQKQLKNDDEVEDPIDDEPIEIEITDKEDDEDDENIEDDEQIIERLSLKYKNLKRQYENELLHRKRR